MIDEKDKFSGKDIKPTNNLVNDEQKKLGAKVLSVGDGGQLKRGPKMKAKK